MLTSERIQEAMDDAVKRGRMTRADAEDMMQSLITAGRKQTEDVVSDLEQLMGRGRGVRRAARGRASDGTDRALQQVDRARRAAGLGSFPILRYDDLTASQIADRVSDLTAAQLRKVRDYEKRHANRKSVIGAISRRLG